MYRHHRIFLKRCPETLGIRVSGHLRNFEAETAIGIVKETVTAIRGAADDQWKEVFCVGEMDSDRLMTRAKN